MSSAALADRPRFYVFPMDKGTELLKQCSRETPENVNSFFAPELSEIVDMEQQLMPYLIRIQLHINLQNYSRQYIGFVADGKRYIYGNFFKTGAGVKHPASEAVDMC